jgi:hypothetical protein
VNTQEFIEFCEGFRPALRSEQPFEIFASLFGIWKICQSMQHDKARAPKRYAKQPDRHVMPATLCDAMAELVPDMRDFWLRAGATLNIRFVEGMTALMQGPSTTAPGAQA